MLASLLWFGFLIHLEWRHRDRGRALWPWYMWAVPWLLVVLLWHDLTVLIFLACACFYSLKKRFRPIAAVSPVLNGALKAMLILGASVTAGMLSVSVCADSHSKPSR
ncbi:hypothetical protein ACFQX7_39145 [Luedemannella flava]